MNRLAVVFFLFFSLVLVSRVEAQESVGHWRFDETDGSVTFQNGAELSKGRFSYGLTLDGVDDYAEVAPDPAFSAPPLSVSLWVKPLVSPPSTNAILVRKLHSANPWISYQVIHRASDGRVGFTVSDPSGFVTRIFSDEPAEAGEWVHVVATLSAAGEMGLFVDGRAQTDTDTAPAVLIADSFLSIGGDANNGYFAGQIDDVRVFDAVLDAQDVRSLTYGYACDTIPDPAPNSPFTNDEHTVLANGITRTQRVEDPYVHSVSLYLPLAELPEQSKIKCGFLDVTEPPYNADPTGNTISTDAFNQALEDGRRYMMAVFVPPGNYLIDDTIECAQGLMSEPAVGPNRKFVVEDRQGACVLVGSRAQTDLTPFAGEDVARPRLTLIMTNDSPDFRNVDNPRPLIHFWARCNWLSCNDNNLPAPGISFNNAVIGIDIDVSGYAGAAGIDLDGAQGSSLEDITIKATDSFGGLLALPAPGGGTHNITVIDGRYGINTRTNWADETSLGSVPVLTGSTFRGQTVSAIRYTQLETLSAVGLDIEMASGATTAIDMYGWSHSAGYLTVVDSSIRFVDASTSNTAISSNRSVYAQNLYVENTDTTVSTADNGTSATLSGNPTGWRHYPEYAAFVTPRANHVTPFDQYYTTTYLDGIAQSSNEYGETDFVDNQPPAPSLQLQHQWHEPTFPHWESPDAVNVKLPPYNAQGDFTSNDNWPIQRAVNENDIVFIPKGYYNLKNTIELQENTALIGTARHLSHLIVNQTDGAFGDPTNPQPAVRSPYSPTATTTLNQISINQPTEYAGAFPLQWRSGADSLIRSINITSRSLTRSSGNPQPSVPQVLISTAHGGGRWYGYFRDFRYSGNGWSDSATFRMIKVDGTNQKLVFYDFNPEGQSTGGSAKAEINNASDVTIYAYKDENRQTSLLINDSNVQLYGYGGFGYGDDNQALFEIDGDSNVILAGLVTRGVASQNDVNKWWIVRDRTLNPATCTHTDSGICVTDNLDRPILYKAGTVSTVDVPTHISLSHSETAGLPPATQLTIALLASLFIAATTLIFHTRKRDQQTKH